MRKSKFFVIVLAMILILSLTFVLTACGGDEGDEEGPTTSKPCKHTYVQNFNDNNHWLECSKCENKIEIVAHEFVADYHDSKHYQACTGCAYTKDAATHEKVWVVENDLHWEECKDCDFTSVKSVHKFDAEGVCICGMTIDNHNHTAEETISFDGISHWHYCVGCNHNADESVAHNIVDGKCTVCDYYEGSEHIIYSENIITGIDIDAVIAEFEANKGEGEEDNELPPLNIVVSNASGKFVIDTIGGGAFANRDKIKIQSITLPETIKVIQGSAFSNRTELETINYAGTMEQWKNINKMYNWDNGMSENLKIVCKDGVIAKDGTETPTTPIEPTDPDEPSEPNEPVNPPEVNPDDNKDETEN